MGEVGTGCSMVVQRNDFMVVSKTHNWNDVFTYDPVTGILRWKINPSTQVQCGDIAGSENSDGYLRVRYKKKTHFVHRIIYEMVHGSIPRGKEIDHRNRIRSENQIDNLRPATHLENCRNISMSPRNTSGIIGVGWYKITGKWRAYVTVSCRIIHLGYFFTKSEAHEARLKAEKRYFGAFAPSILRV